MYHGIPFPSPIRDGWPWTNTHDRKYLVSASIGIHGSFAIRKLRQTLRDECIRDERCSFQSTNNQYEIYKSYQNSTFCLNPPGDAISRRAVIDSTLLGCIPVLFHYGQRIQWPWHWSWGINTSVILPSPVNYSVINSLEEISNETIQKMQKNIKDNAASLVYRTYDNDYDAFAIALRKVAESMTNSNS